MGRASIQLEEDLADLTEVVPDGVLDLLQGGKDGLGLCEDPVLEPPELEDGAGDGLGEAVVDVDRPLGALLQQEGIDRVRHGRMHAPSVMQGRARGCHSRPFGGDLSAGRSLGLGPSIGRKGPWLERLYAGGARDLGGLRSVVRWRSNIPQGSMKKSCQ